MTPANENPRTTLCAGTNFECDCNCECGRGLGINDCEWPECGKAGLCHCDDDCKGCALARGDE